MSDADAGHEVKRRMHEINRWTIVIGLLPVLLIAVTGCHASTPGPTVEAPQPEFTEVPPPAAPTNTPVPTAAPDSPTPLPAAEPGPTRISPKDGMVQIYVPAGEFLMGSPGDDPQGYRDEMPQHTVYLDGYWVDQTEVTNTMFRIFIEETGYVTDAEESGWGHIYDPPSMSWKQPEGANWLHPRGPGSDIAGLDDHPAAQVSWFDAAAYCEWAGRRMLTEAEWEKAARGTDGRIYPWGNDPVAGNLLNFADHSLNVDGALNSVDDGYEFTAPVGSYPDGAGPYGALDMAGNVWEWVADWYDPGYYTISPASNPTGPAEGDNCVLRGGSWHDSTGYVRTTTRYFFFPDGRGDRGGIRCAESG